MKTLICCAALSIFLTVSGFAQNKSELLYRSYKSTRQTASVSQFLNDISSQTGIIIEYSTNIELDKEVSLDGNEASLGAVLQKVLINQRVRVVERNRKIIIVPATKELEKDELLPVYSFFGFIKEEVSLEPLIDATIYESDARRGLVTNSHGYFSIPLTEGKHKLKISYTGYRTIILDVDIHSNLRQDIVLAIKEEIEQVVVKSDRGGSRNGSDKVSGNQNVSYNYLLGENDPVRSLYLLPGIKNVRESFNGIVVRGGGTDQNLFLLDGNPVYNPTHMLGALSIVNQTSLKSMRVYKSFFPSKFGGALSSVFDVFTKDGNMESWLGEVNLGVMAGCFTLEGPVVKNKTAMMTSFRHSWSSPMVHLFQKGIRPDFYDFHFKATHLLNKNSKLLLHYYQGRDQIRQNQENIDNLHKWGNRVGSVGWNHVIKSKVFLTTSLNLSGYNNLGGYKYTFTDENGQALQYRSLGTFSSIHQYNGKTEAEIYAGNKLKLNLGLKLSYSTIRPFDTKVSKEVQEDRSAFNSFQSLSFLEKSGYLESEWKINKRIFLRTGGHISDYQFKDYRYFSWQPRLYSTYKISRRQQVFVAFNKMVQYLHLVTNPYLGVNSDIWVPSTSILQPEESRSYTVGYMLKTKTNAKLKINAYWKDLKNVTNYAEGKSYFVNSSNWQQNIQTGKGWSYGTELAIDKTQGKASLHLAYTLSWTWRQFTGVNNGNRFPYKYDRRNDMNLGFSYRHNKKLDFSLLWSFATGDVFSMPDRISPDYDNSRQISNPDDLLMDYRFIYHYSGLNQYRNPHYHRLDLAANYHTAKEKKVQSVIVAGVYNIYGSPDQYRYDLKGSLNNPSTIIMSSNTLFNITPYISYTIKF